jgi:hypothetical protein
VNRFKLHQPFESDCSRDWYEKILAYSPTTD